MYVFFSSCLLLTSFLGASEENKNDCDRQSSGRHQLPVAACVTAGIRSPKRSASVAIPIRNSSHNQSSHDQDASISRTSQDPDVSVSRTCDAESSLSRSFPSYSSAAAVASLNSYTTPSTSPRSSLRRDSYNSNHHQTHGFDIPSASGGSWWLSNIK